MNKKSKDVAVQRLNERISKEARLCVSKKINRKKEKRLIGIMRSLTLVLIVMLLMHCISSFNYKLDYKVPETKGEKLEPINFYYSTGESREDDMQKMTFWGGLIWAIFGNYNGFHITSPLLKEEKTSQYTIYVQHYQNKDIPSFVTYFLSITVIIPYVNYANDRDIVIAMFKEDKDRGNRIFTGKKTIFKIGKSSERAIGWLPLLPVQFVWSLFGDPNDSAKEKKLKEELAPIVYHILKEQMAKDAIEATSTPAISNNPSTPTSGFTDTVVLKNGDFIENVKATVTIDSLIVTDANGKTTVYKKSQVLTVKKK